MQSVQVLRRVLLALPTTTLGWAALLFLTPGSGVGASWQAIYNANSNGPGQQLEIKCDQKLLARLLYGTGQMKPFLHIYGSENQELTNGGLDTNGVVSGQFPHHRGIFIGWKVNSNLGTYDLWHMTAGAHMDLTEIETKTGQDHATIHAQIKWAGGKKDAEGRDLLLTETRQLKITHPRDRIVQVDAQFTLLPARDLKLEGDLQHAGVHFRAAHEVNEKQTSYLFEPQKVKGDNLKWCRLLFPLGNHWYAVQEMNAPSNPVEELSTREYGRFGYFFKKALSKDQPLELHYRFVIEEVATPEKPPKLNETETEAALTRCRELYEKFVASLK